MPAAQVHRSISADAWLSFHFFVGQAGPLKGAVGHLITLLVQWDLSLLQWASMLWLAGPLLHWGGGS